VVEREGIAKGSTGGADEATDGDVFTRGRRAWPGVEITAAQYVKFSRERLPPGAKTSEAHADLYLACACSLGVPAAQEALDRVIMADVPKAIRRVSAEPDFVADVAADLRLALLAGTDGKPSLLERYQGKGPLRSYVMVLAMRRSIDRKRRQKEVVTEPADLADLAAANPSVIHVGSSELSEAFVAALKEKLSALPSRDRNVLRLHIVDGIPAEAIGRMYGVHRATATRWIADVKRAVFDETRDELQRQFNVSPGTFESFARDAAFGLDAKLSTFLGGR
jgi:RNA polymerase sigma-70 factor (ECF subfamily)